MSARRTRLVRILTVALLVSAPDVARADYKESYLKGMEAADKGNWPEVARRMREASAEQGKEGEKLRLYGMRFEEYLPNYYLGLALFNAGDCQGALTAFSASEGQGAVQKTGQFKVLAKNKGVCQAKVAQSRPVDKPQTPAGPDPAAVAQATRTAEQTIASADEDARAVSGFQGDQALAGRWEQDPALGSAQRQAAELLASARAKLDSGRRKPDLRELTEANDLATRASLQLMGVKQMAGIRRDEARRAAAEPLKTTPASAAPGTSPAGPPADLVNAARAYFEGRYREAAVALARASYPPGRSSAQAMLFRAASRHALYVLGGEKDDALKQDARADVQACRRADPSFAPDPRFFSPRFTSFFKTAQ